jgi:transposase-like protein
MKRQKIKSKLDRWTRDPTKEGYWRKQLALWQASGLSIRAFCREHGVVETSFYAWRRELIVRAREDGTAEEITGADRTTPNIVKDGRGRTISIRYRQTDQPIMQALLKDGEKPNPFIPIRIAQEKDGVEAARQTPLQESEVESQAEIEIALPGGAVIRLKDNSNLRLLAELLSILKG